MKKILGIELGSTRIKGVLLDDNHEMLAQGGFSWENRLENGIWTYHIDEVWTDMWFTNEEEYSEYLDEVISAEVEYRVKIYN